MATMSNRHVLACAALLVLAACKGDDPYRNTWKDKVARGEALCAAHGGLKKIHGGGKYRPKATCNDGAVFHRRTGKRIG